MPCAGLGFVGALGGVSALASDAHGTANCSRIPGAKPRGTSTDTSCPPQAHVKQLPARTPGGMTTLWYENAVGAGRVRFCPRRSCTVSTVDGSPPLAAAGAGVYCDDAGRRAALCFGRTGSGESA